MRRAQRPAPASAGEPLTGLAPLAAPDARVLILGSMPGVISLKQQQYYAHPQNRFWPMISMLIGIDLAPLPYARRVQHLLTSGIAVWDVLRQCQRAGSLDADIVRSSEVPNDFPRFFRGHPRIRAVFLNGGAAARAFQRHAGAALARSHPDVRVTGLPSTSPANASQSSTSKRLAWMQIQAALKPPA